jgi:hypothetical protein
MEESKIYGQQDFNLPHDVVKLPSQGLFYKDDKKSVKVGYLTAQDENYIINSAKNGNFINVIVKNKVYEPNFNVNELLEGDIEAILLFLRNTSFGSDYAYKLLDPVTNKTFETTIRLDEVDFKKLNHQPNKDGHFEFNLPKSNYNVVCKLLNYGEISELLEIENKYPEGIIPPTVTNRLQKQIISIDGEKNPETLSKIIMSLPIMDSKFLRNTLRECEPKLDLERTVIAPSGEKVTFNVTFGVEFFRPFF